MHCIHLVYMYIYIYIYIRVVRRALNLLRASFSPIFQYFSAVLKCYTHFLTCTTLCICHGAMACAMDSSAMEGAVHSHRDFRIRRSVVHRVLNWLITHNQYYRSNHVHIDVNALEHDGNLSQLTAIVVENAITEPPATNTPATGPPVADTPATSEDPYSAHLPVFCSHCHSIYDRAGGSASVCSGATIKPIHLIITCHHDVALYWRSTHQ